MDPRLIPVHTKVPGRARFKISCANRSPNFTRWIDTRILRLSGIRTAKFNAVTGSLLVFYDPGEDWRTVSVKITTAMNRSAPGNLKSSRNPVEPHETDVEGLPISAVKKPNASRHWHQLEPDHILNMFDSSLDRGLDPKTVERRFQTHGPNIIPEAQLRRPAETFKDQFMFLPMSLLMIETLSALFGGAVIEAALISIIMAVNVTVGYLIDRRAEQALMVFKQRPRPSALVLRAGRWVEMPGENLVVGDVLKLAPGTYVGADCRIIKAAHLKIDESILTGESDPVDKNVDIIQDPVAPLFEQRNMAFMGTLVVGGEGVAVVVAAGSMTEYGKLSAIFRETIPPQTPVIRKIQALSGTLLRTAIGMGFGVGLLGLLRGRSILQTLGRAASIAAAGLPAGLPSAATVNMAIGFQRLRRENVSIRRLYSLESLSAVQMICFDKTGTLTRSRIDVEQIYCGGKNIRIENRAFWASKKPLSPLVDADLRRLLQACVLCSESKIRLDPETGRRQITGSPTEVALMHLAVMAGFDLEAAYRRYPLEKIQHRGDIKRYMVTTHTAPDGRPLIFVKGDPMEILEMCTRQIRGGRHVDLSEAAENDIEFQNQRLAGEAMRVLGFAYSNRNVSPDHASALQHLTWIGLVGMAEPIREGVVSLMDHLHLAGIQTVMITGDQSTTAEAVARKIRLYDTSETRIFDTSRFDALTPELASALIRDVKVFVRVNPAQKLQIVQAYQQRGMVVAMTGDGINDGPALRAADVGIAMGLSGTDAAREVADMVLERDNISAVKTAVMEGRTAFRNLKRSLRFFIATHFSEVLFASIASSILPSGALLEFRPVHISLLTDLTPGLALLMEPASPDIGRESPRNPEEPIFSPRDILALLSESAFLTGGALAAFGYGWLRYGLGSKAATLAYESLSAAKVFHALTCRPLPPDDPNAAKQRANPVLNTAIFAALSLQAGTILIPGLRRLLNIAPLNLLDLAIIGLTALATRSINQGIRKERRIESKDDRD